MNGIQKQNASYDHQIDSTLRLLGSVDPRPGIEQRIAARIADAPAGKPANGLFGFLGIPRFALTSAFALVAFVAIVAASVSHSRHLLPVAPGLQLPGNHAGLGAVDAKKVAPKPVTPPANGRPRSVRKFGDTRSTSNPDGQKPNGVAVPATPLQQQ